MEEPNNQSSEPLLEQLQVNSRPPNEKEEEIRNQKIENNDEQGQLSSSNNNSSDCTVDNASIGERGDSRASISEALVLVPLSNSDIQFDESSHLLSEVPVEYSLQPLPSVEELKDQVRELREKPLKGNTGQSVELQLQHQIQIPDGPSRLELSSTSATHSISSISSSTLPEQNLQPAITGNKTFLTEMDKQNSPVPKPLSSVPMMKTPSDGYNWRKYGQKQVKSPEGSRSYYRCTFSECYAKKIECSDRSNRAVETVYRSHHNHEPPPKLNCSRENKPALPVVPINGSSGATQPVTGLNDPVASSLSKEPLPTMDEIHTTKQQESSAFDETMEINVKDECVDGPENKKRQKRISAGESGSFPKPGNKSKFVVHAAGDVGMSGDGYRWRKYGQKMVKGNPYPRNYFRCTSAGCPVRKHIERAVDNTSAVVITYKGIHDHDMPVPRKRDGSKSAPVIAASSPVSSDNMQINKTDVHQNRSREPADKVEKLSREKTSESTRTLLSMGFEIKPC